MMARTLLKCRKFSTLLGLIQPILSASPPPKKCQRTSRRTTRKRLGSCLSARKPQLRWPVVAYRPSCEDRDTQEDLAKQIDALLNESNSSKAIPTALRQTVDVIRHFGNFSAHPVTDQTTLQIIPVELGEAEWCLDILEEMFDHYYVKPAEAKARKAALDAKLTAANKPRSK
jgi:Domain of unknown function (DUF4145)